MRRLGLEVDAIAAPSAVVVGGGIRQDVRRVQELTRSALAFWPARRIVHYIRAATAQTHGSGTCESWRLPQAHTREAVMACKRDRRTGSGRRDTQCTPCQGRGAQGGTQTVRLGTWRG